MFSRFVALCVRNKCVSNHCLSTSVVRSIANPKGPTGPVLETRVQGNVLWFDATKGFGFIQRSDNQQDVFVHLTSIKGKNPAHQTRTLADGEPVEFDVIQGKAGFEAVAVTGPCGFPVQGNPMGLYSRRQISLGYNAGAAGGRSGAGPGPNFPDRAPSPSWGAGSAYGGAPMGGGYNPPQQIFGNPYPPKQGFGGPAPGGFGGPVPGAGGYGFGGNRGPGGF